MHPKSTLARDVLGPRSAVEAARNGLPYGALDRVGEALFGERPPAERTRAFSKVLGVSERTITRRRARPAEPLPSDLSDRLLVLAETYDLAVRALGGEERARAWLLGPHARLQGETPLDHLDTLAGVREVETLLYHVEYGMPA